MIDQSFNGQFHGSSFMQGRNAEYKIEAMKKAGIVVAYSPATLGEAVLKAIG